MSNSSTSASSSPAVESPPKPPTSSSPSQTVPSGGPPSGGPPSTSSAPGQMGGAGEWMAHVKRTMRANPGKKLKDVLKMAKKTYKKGTKKTARKTRKGSRKSKSWFMGGSAIVAAPAGGPGSLTGGRRRKH